LRFQVVVADWAALRAFLTAETKGVTRTTSRLIAVTAGIALTNRGRQRVEIVDLEFMSVTLRVRKPTRSPILIRGVVLVELLIDGASHAAARGGPTASAPKVRL
jgi:hypothetical protein